MELPCLNKVIVSYRIVSYRFYQITEIVQFQEQGHDHDKHKKGFTETILNLI